MRGLAVAMLGVLLVGGCSSAAMVRDGSRQAPQSWVARHGGLHDGEPALRVQRVADRFSAVLPLRPIARLLDSSDLAAWSWPGGEIYVTQALAEMLSDDELAAVIGHELGHMDLADGHPHAAALAATDASDDVEQRADRRGVELLTRSGQSPAAMREALTKLSTAPRLSPSTRLQLVRRVAALSALN
jgi:Zn-dependent protease with chaperone function